MKESLEQFGYKQELKRVLTFKDLVIYGMLFMVVIAPMSVYGFISKDSQGMAPLVYLVGLTAMVFTALSYSKMSQRFPIAGSVYAYVQRAINPHVGFVSGWLILLDYVFIPALLYILTANWCVALFPGLLPFWAWVVIFIAINTVINVRGIEYTAKTDTVILILEVLALAVFIIAGILFVAKGGGTGGFVIDPLWQSDKVNLSFIATAATIACLSFLGFDGISTLAEETHDPQRTVGRAMITCLILIGVCFIGQTYIATLILPDYNAINPDTAYFDAAAAAAGEWLRTALLIINIIAVGLANTLTAQAATSRVLYSMSRDKLLPGFLNDVHKKFQTPYLATIFVGFWSMVCALAIDLDNIIKLVNFGALTAFMMLNFSVFWFFYIKEKNRGLKGFINYALLPLMGLFVLVFVWTGFDKVTQIVGFSWLAIGIAWGAYKSNFYKEVPEAFKNLDLNS